MTCWKLINSRLWLVERFRYSDQQQQQNAIQVSAIDLKLSLDVELFYSHGQCQISGLKPCFGQIPAKTNDLIIYDCEVVFTLNLSVVTNN